MHASVLTRDNAKQALEVMQSRKNFLAITDAEALETQRYMAQRNLENLMDPHFAAMGTLFGVWSDAGQMQALLITLFSNQQPCFYINKAYTVPGATLDVLPVGLKLVMQHHEALGYRRFYALYSKSNLETYKRLWRKSALLKDYDCYTEYESAPLERPKFQEFWEMLFGRMLYNEPMIVRAFIQQEHARPATV